MAKAVTKEHIQGCTLLNDAGISRTRTEPCYHNSAKMCHILRVGCVLQRLMFGQWTCTWLTWHYVKPSSNSSSMCHHCCKFWEYLAPLKSTLFLSPSLYVETAQGGRALALVRITTNAAGLESKQSGF